MIKVLMIADFPENVQEYFRHQLTGWGELVIPDNASEETLCELASDVEIIFGWQPTERLLQAAHRLKLFINPGAGVENLVPLFRKYPKVTLVNSHGNAYAVAQHGLAMILALANQLIPHHNWMVEGKWKLGDAAAKSTLLRHKTLGLLGFGGIGQRLAQFTSGFELRRIVYKNRPLEARPDYIDQVFYGDEFEEFLRQTDLLVVGVPLNQHTLGMIGKKELELLGSEGMLLHLARGPVVEEEALYTALRDGVIKGAAIEVWYEYQPAPDAVGRKYPYHYPFHELPNVVLSPHRADSPDDDLMRWDDILTNIRKVYEGREDYLNQVDLEQGY